MRATTLPHACICYPRQRRQLTSEDLFPRTIMQEGSFGQGGWGSSWTSPGEESPHWWRMGHEHLGWAPLCHSFSSFAMTIIFGPGMPPWTTNKLQLSPVSKSLRLLRSRCFTMFYGPPHNLTPGPRAYMLRTEQSEGPQKFQGPNTSRVQVRRGRKSFDDRGYEFHATKFLNIARAPNCAISAH
jgi:hypothetical protein